MARERNTNTSNVISAETQQPQASNNVIGGNTLPASNFPAARGNVIQPIVARMSPNNDKVRLVPISGGVGTVMTRERAKKAVKTSGGQLVIREL